MEVLCYVAYIVIFVVLNLIVSKIISYKNKKSSEKNGRGLKSESIVYQNLEAEFVLRKSYAYNSDEIQKYKEILSVGKDELYHAKSVIASDLDTVGIISIIHTVITALVSLIFSILSEWTTTNMEALFKVTLDASVIENFLSIYFMGMTVFYLYKSMNTYRKEKYFLSLIEAAIEEKNQNDIVEVEALKQEIYKLKKKIKKLNNKKKK